MNVALIGLLGIIAISGCGRGMVRIATRTPLVLHWYVSISILTGIGISAASVQLLAAAGVSRDSLALVGVLIAICGIISHWLTRANWAPQTRPRLKRADTLVAVVLGFAILFCLFAALAPSTKIDELHYHMLASKRVVEDGGLRIYQLPEAQSIFSQMGYQVGLSVFHALGAPDAGNLISLTSGLATLLLIHGIVAEETGSFSLALLTATLCAIGIYPAVWHVTGGPHALGDLGTVTAAAALLFPGSLRRAGAMAPALVCALASAVAATTKVSLIPLGLLMTAAPLCFSEIRRAALRYVVFAAVIWLVIDGPMIGWTAWHTGSPLGAATATFFQSSAYEPKVFAALENSRQANQSGLWAALRTAAINWNGAVVLLFFAGIWFCFVHWRHLGLLLFFIGIQLGLIAVWLPHDFRFLGGLEYSLAVAGIVLAAPKLIERRGMGFVRAALLSLAAPWFLTQAWYIMPFAKVTLGLVSRTEFLKRYVAFTEDFRELDNLLPEAAALLVVGSRAPSFYFPRPVIYSFSDWDGRSRLFRFRVSPTPETPQQPVEDAFGRWPAKMCGELVYRNDHAIIETYRQPGLQPTLGTLLVERCTPLNTPLNTGQK